MDWNARNVNFNNLIKQLFHEKETEKRAEAARQLGFLKDGRAVNLLCRALNIEDEPMVVNRIIEALGQIADGRATLRIIEKLKEEIEKPEIEMDKLKRLTTNCENLPKMCLIRSNQIGVESLKKLVKKDQSRIFLKLKYS